MAKQAGRIGARKSPGHQKFAQGWRHGAMSSPHIIGLNGHNAGNFRAAMAAWGAILCLCFPSLSLADKILLKTGATVEGRILREDDNQIVVFSNGLEMPIQRSRMVQAGLQTSSPP